MSRLEIIEGKLYQLHSVPVKWSSEIWSFWLYFGYLVFGKLENVFHCMEFWKYGHFGYMINFCFTGTDVDHISGTECTLLVVLDLCSEPYNKLTIWLSANYIDPTLFYKIFSFYINGHIQELEGKHEDNTGPYKSLLQRLREITSAVRGE